MKLQLRHGHEEGCVCVCVCGLGGVRMTLGRNVEGDCGVQLDLQISGLGKQVACRAVNW